MVLISVLKTLCTFVFNHHLLIYKIKIEILAKIKSYLLRSKPEYKIINYICLLLSPSTYMLLF